jgi:ABC-type multidrug transport system fused ATPase/permease subunit
VLSNCHCDGGCSAPPLSTTIFAIVMTIVVTAIAFFAWRCRLRQWYKRWKRARRQRTVLMGQVELEAIHSPLMGDKNSSAALPSGQDRNNSDIDDDDTGTDTGHTSALDSVNSLSNNRNNNGARPHAQSMNSSASSKYTDSTNSTHRPTSTMFASFGFGLGFGVNRRQSLLRTSMRINSSDLQRALSLNMNQKPFPIDIAFDKMSLRVQAGGHSKTVLENVSGELRHGRVCAVLGVSGAGKTTFLTSLAGKASYGKLSGSVTINGKPGMLTDAKYRHLVGFVPQEDVMMRDLTVEENITFSAMTRLPSTWSAARKVLYAENVMQMLDLTDIADSIVGDETNRGISGGVRTTLFTVSCRFTKQSRRNSEHQRA